MNKSNKILIVVLTFIVVCVVGYALFSENITVTGSATAKGSFDITTTCEKGANSALLASIGVSPSDIGEGGYDTTNEVCSISNNTVTVKSELKYPSARRYFTVKFENTGTMDAFVKSAGSILNGGTDVISVYENIKVYNSSTNALIKELVEEDGTQSGDISNYARTSIAMVLPQKVDGTFLLGNDEYHDNDMLYLDNEGASYLKISPGQSIYLVLNMYWKEEATTQGVYSVNTSKITFDFKQKTNDFTLSDKAYTCFGGC